jgi:hypothetical protein
LLEFLESEDIRFIIGEILYLEPLIEELLSTILTEEEKSKIIANKISNLALDINMCIILNTYKKHWFISLLV